MLHIHTVDTSRRRDVRRFINFPFDLYRDHPLWVPQMHSESLSQLNHKDHPFYKTNEAIFFIAELDGKDVGRVAVLNPRDDNVANDTQDAYFYLFDAIDDQSVANALFDKGAAWARERGLTTLRGPLGFLPGDGYGLLSKGFEHHPALGIAYNYAYYVDLVENWGFEVEERFFSGYVDLDRLREEFPMKILKLADRIKDRYGFTPKTFRTKRELRGWVGMRLGDLYERAFSHVERNRHLTQEHIERIGRNLLAVARPQLLKFVMKDDEIVGFIFCFVDVSNGIRKAKGRLFPFGWLPILLEFRRTEWINFNGIGIVPEYQGKGGTALMYAELYHTLYPQFRFKHADSAQVSEFNTRSLNENLGFGMDMYKTHSVYRREL